MRSATALASAPVPSLAQALRHPAALKALYRLLHTPDITAASVTAAHRTQTLTAARAEATVLLVQDTTELDSTHHLATEDLGPIGNGRCRGYLLQRVLAIRPPSPNTAPGASGLAALDPFLRTPKPPGETRTERTQRPRESDAWLRRAEAIGEPVGACGRSGADLFRLFQTVQAHRAEVLVRVAQDRRVRDAAGEPTRLRTQAHALRPGEGSGAGPRR